MKRNKILIVDDDISLLKAINYTLRNKSYEVVTSNNGKEALDILKKDNEILVLLIDLNMPLYTGVEFLTEIKDFNRPLQRIVMTATEDILTPQMATDLHVLTYLTKPYRDFSLLFTIESAFNKLELEEAKRWKDLAFITTDTIHLIGNKISPIRRRIDEILKVILGLHYEEKIDQECFNKILRDIEIIKDGAEQVHLIKSDLIDGSINKKAIDIVKILNESVIRCRNEEDSEEIQIDLISKKKSFIIVAEENFFRRVTCYIIKNAVHAIEDKISSFKIDKVKYKGNINITTYSSNERFIIDFSDNGTGINESDLPKIFNPFFTTKGADRGNGVGLYFCKRIIEDIGGEIKVLNTKIGIGTTISIAFPLN